MKQHTYKQILLDNVHRPNYGFRIVANYFTNRCTVLSYRVTCRYMSNPVKDISCELYKKFLRAKLLKKKFYIIFYI